MSRTRCGGDRGVGGSNTDGIGLAFPALRDQIMGMATRSDTATHKKAGVLGRSAATGRYVMAPVAAKKGTLSDKRITAAVKSVLAKKK